MRNPAGPLPRTASDLPSLVRARLGRLEDANPEWRTALAAIREVLAALEGSAIATLTRRAEPWQAPQGIPRLQGETITVRSRALGQLFARLDSAAGLGTRHSALGGLAVQLDQAIRETGTVSAPARFAAIVVLTQCALALDREHDDWSAGFCPVCAAWPLFGETRGLERIRRLRCGRCGADWRGELLRCVCCGERDHTRLGTLVPQGEPGSAAVETCSSCRGYLKTVTTLGPLTGAELWLTDFETVELDLAARDAGFARPAGLGFPLEIVVAAA